MISFKYYLRNILKNKVFSAITIGSYVVSLTVVIILTAFISSEFSFDRHISDVDRIFRVIASKNEVNVPEESRTLILNRIPEVESTTNYLIGTTSVVYNGTDMNVKLINTDEGIFSILPITFIKGTPSGIFDVKTNAVITSSLAKRIFGDEDPVGKIITVSHEKTLTIAGIIRDFPEKSTLNGELICSAELRVIYSQSCYNNNCTTFYRELVKLKPGASQETVNLKLGQVIPKMNEKDDNKYTLHPYKNVYFDTSYSRDGLAHCNIKLLKLLVVLTVVLLAMSIFNYINLSIANNIGRFKEFGVKMVLGASGNKIFGQFLVETSITILFSSLIAVIIAGLVKPVFVGIFDRNFNISDLFSKPSFISGSIAAILSIALISAVYPARVAMNSEAKNLLQKRSGGKKKSFDIRRTLNVIQFTASIIIIISLIVITRQINFVKNRDFGFSTEQLIQVPLHWKAERYADVLKDEIGKLPGVKSVCYSHGIPGSITTYNDDGETGKVDMITSDAEFATTFGLNLIGGRNFFKGEQAKVCLINTTAMKQAGWSSFEGKKLFGFSVVGLVSDFNYESLYNKIGALMIANGKDVSHFTVRMNPGDIQATLAGIKSTFRKILPDYDYSFRFYDEFLDSMYKQEEKRAQAVRIIALLVIFISCIGLIGLVEFSTRNRVKEIGIRKVNGASVGEVIMMLNTDLVIWIISAFVFSVPVAWYLMHQWLFGFAYKTRLSWWVFALSGLITLVIALLAVSWQSWRAATRNPVEALRYE